MSTRLTPERYLALIDADTERLLMLAARGLKTSIPCLDGWDVAEVVWHLAGVYEHKVRVMADNAWPDPWPPPDFEYRDEIEFLREAKGDLFDELMRHDVGEQTTTFSADDTTIGFWIRRMALEAAVHRYDVELALEDPTPVSDDLALDGIDEVLRVMLAGPWWRDRVHTAHPVDAVVSVESAGRRWRCALTATSVTVESTPVTVDAAATVSGPPQDVFLWLWGRVGEDRVEMTGDTVTGQRFRARLAECTG